MKTRVKKLSKIEKLKAVARGELPVAALFNSKEVIVAKHNRDGSYDVNGERYTAEQWEAFKDLDITCIVFKAFDNGTHELETTEPRPSWYDRQEGSGWGWGTPFSEKDNQVGNKQTLQLETVKEIKDTTIYTYNKPEKIVSEPVKRESEKLEESEPVQSNQEYLRKIRNEWNWHDVPFSNWLNRLGR